MHPSAVPERVRFSLVHRARSFVHAGRGLRIFVQTTHNAWVQLVILALTIFGGWYFRISHSDWLAITLAAGLVLCAEALNTAIEIDINLTSPEYHPFARDTKDVAAAAVLIASGIALVVALIVFGPHLVLLRR
jgi:diacylglycerol kinase (ATP)